MAMRGPGERDEEDDPLVRLMVEYQGGGLEAFERLYAALAGDLRRYFGAASRGDSTPDLVQETFMEMHRSRQTYRPPLPVRPWAFGIARNILRRHRRLAWRRGRLEEPGGGGDPAAEATAGASGIEARDVEGALQRLPAGKRRAWELHHVHGFSFEEVGRMLRIPEGAAKLRSSRAMGALRALLGVGGRQRD